MIWRFLYRMLPGLSFMDLAGIPNWYAFYLIEGAAFYRSDILVCFALALLVAAVVAFVRMGQNGLDILHFTHLFWRISSLFAMVLVLITILAALFIHVL
ncbi:hypothetical protein [Fructobacillus papyrifericola]|uniref:Uncharacterized protein n=1 Tax=Fructobacillus papyrifericola TaxID=2713172 RepID=A0ABS5QSP0_9LACO|nr:hypothetical protein [Fructobacillus papyrifericola]MBS9336216.1 hypothetical protein [Fructobacillus papyrifericola]